MEDIDRLVQRGEQGVIIVIVHACMDHSRRKWDDGVLPYLEGEFARRSRDIPAPSGFMRRFTADIVNTNVSRWTDDNGANADATPGVWELNNVPTAARGGFRLKYSLRINAADDRVDCADAGILHQVPVSAEFQSSRDHF